MNAYASMGQSKADAVCDFRSDTLTTPCEGMRAAMAAAEVGDDVYGEDPTVMRLEEALAARLGKEAGVFFATGTQSNLAALLSHCGRGDEVLVGEHQHIRTSEAAGASVLGGIAIWPLAQGVDGVISAEAVRAAVKPDDTHYPVSRLLCLENTLGGVAVPLDTMRATADAGRGAGLAVHLDGARFFNATTALGCSATDLAGAFDTVSVCLSKGLGAPVGSVLVGEWAVLEKARRWRKMLGGGMRQAGVIAAAGLYALEHTVERLAEDHARAERLAGVLREAGATARHATNMVFLTIPDGQYGALRDHMAERGVSIGGEAREVRLVIHRDVGDAALKVAMAGFSDFFRV